MSATLTAAPAQTHESQRPTTRRWIYDFGRDFWLIHGGCGLVSLPVALVAFLAPSLWMPLFFAYTLFLGLPHIGATHVRLHLDADCRRRYFWMAFVAPAAIAGLVGLVVFAWHQLPLLVLGWFVAQTWHANRQNFGIMRRYMRMAGSEPGLPINRLAESLVELLPWAAVSTCLVAPAKLYLGYPISLPDSSWLLPVTLCLWAVTAAIALMYLVLEGNEWRQGRLVPGRLMCVVTGSVVNVLAWVVVGEVSWAYLVVSTWHALQYIAYVHAFRSSPPPQAQVLRMSLKPHLMLLALAGLALYGIFQSVMWLIPPMVVVFHLGMNFHHYLSDALIWRVAKPAQRPSAG